MIHINKILLLQTDIRSIRSKPNMRYTKVSGKPFLRKSDYVNSIVRACARKYHFVFFTTCLSKLSLIYYLYFITLHIKVLLTGPNRCLGRWYSTYHFVPMYHVSVRWGVPMT